MTLYIEGSVKIYINIRTETLPFQALKVFYNYMKYEEYYTSLLPEEYSLVFSYVGWWYLTTFVKLGIDMLYIRSIITDVIYYACTVVHVYIYCLLLLSIMYIFIFVIIYYLL